MNPLDDLTARVTHQQQELAELRALLTALQDALEDWMDAEDVRRTLAETDEKDWIPYDQLRAELGL